MDIYPNQLPESAALTTMVKARSRKTGREALAWCVHLYTALGLVAAAGIAVLIVQGSPAAFHWSFVLMLAALFIDASDGTLARKVGVKKVLPGFDGRRLDDLTDFLTYTCLPLFFIWRASLLPTGLEWLLLLPLLASAYGFCQVYAKTDDGYFLGFPSYWNLVAFYLYVLHPPGWFCLTLLLVLAFLTFVPARYLYPSQPGTLNRLTVLLGVVWGGLIVWILAGLILADRSPQPGFDTWMRGLTWLSLLYPAYYLLVSWAISLRIWRRRRGKFQNDTWASAAQPEPGFLGPSTGPS